MRIHVVKSDIESKDELDQSKGVAPIPGLRPVVSLGTHDLGGMYDTTRREFVGPSKHPKIWYVTPRALDVVLHSDDIADCQLVTGGFGSGKTLGVLRYWVCAQVLRLAEYAPIEIGVTAPTLGRLDEIINGIKGCMRPDWFVYLRKDRIFHTRLGVRIRCIGTAKRSAAGGSPVQQFNFAACGSDELEDQTEENDNIDARGRRAPFGRYKRCSTATLKAHPDWRKLLMELKASDEWDVSRYIGPENPFVWPTYWKRLKDKMSPQLYARVVMCMDTPGERATYPQWSREHNLRPVPLLGATDVTAKVLGRYGPGFTVMGGHDPGVRWDVTLLLKCYMLPGFRDPVWWVVDEFNTERTSTEQHIKGWVDEAGKRHDGLLDRLRNRWGCNLLDYAGEPLADSDRLHLRIDPKGDTDGKTDKSVYQMFTHHKIHCRSAAYKHGTGKGRVPKDAGIEMVNRLFCAESRLRRLNIDCDIRGNPVAEKLVEALELDERDLLERAETDRKSESDMSHWLATLRYSLWHLEQLPESLARLL